MEVHCAWCEKEGKPSWMRTVSGPPTKSHGICPAHIAVMRAQVADLKKGATS